MPPRNQHVGLIGDCGVQFVFHRHSLRRQLDDIRTRHHWARTGLQLHEYQDPRWLPIDPVDACDDRPATQGSELPLDEDQRCIP